MTQINTEQTRLSLFATWVVRKVWMLFAISIVLIALFMSLLRYSLPMLSEHKAFVEDYISKEYAIDLEIGELSASWQHNGPTVVLRNVVIQRGSNSPLSLQAGEILVEVDFWPTVANQKLQSNQVLLNHFDLEIDVTRIEKADTEFPIVEALEKIFLEQLSNFVVSNSRMSLVSAQNKKDISIANLSWINEGNHHQGVGEFALQDFSDNSASFILDLYGDVNSYSGTLYAQATDIDVTAWINEFTAQNSKLVSSKGNMEVWGQISNGRISRIDGQLLPSEFDWQNNDVGVSNSLQASFTALNTEQRWDFAVSDILLSTNDRLLKTELKGFYSNEQGAVLRIQDKLALNSLFPLVSLYSLPLADKLALVDAQVWLTDLSLKLDQNGPSLIAKFDDIAWQEHMETVGVNTLSAELYWQNDKGTAIVKGKDASLESEYYFGRTLAIEELLLPIHIDTEDSLELSTNSAIVNVDGLKMLLDTDYRFNTQFLSLALDIKEFSVQKVPSLLPNELVGDGTQQFLSRAFQAKGDVAQAKVLWHGRTSDFPFTEQQGIFQSYVSINDADFVFSEDWPALTSLDIELLFENQSLYMNSDASLLDEVGLSNLNARIPSLSQNALLTITADGKGSSEQLTNLMLKSSMADTLGKLLKEDIVIDGNLATQLSLYIPLSEDAQTRAIGDVVVAGNNISIPSVNLDLLNANGTVTFDNALINIEKLNAELFEQQVNIDATGDYIDNQYTTEIAIEGDWSLSPLASNMSDELASLFEGKANWNLDLALNFMPESFNYQASLFSDLEGLSANLPAPFNKDKSEKMPLRVNASGDSVASSIEIRLADLAVFDGALPHKEKQFNRAHLALGPTELETRGLGFSISADFESMEFESWYPFILSLTNGLEKSENPIIGVPQRIFIDTEKLQLAGHPFNDVDITVKRLDNQWEFDVDANEIRGNFNLHDDWYSKGVNADFEYIKLEKTEGQSMDISKNTIDPKTLPSINLRCKSCEFDGMNFGRVEFEAEPNNDGLKINELLLDNGTGNVRASGQWYKRNDDHYTFLGGELGSADFGEFLTRLGLDSGIQDSQANMTFAFTWQGSPLEGSFAVLDGNIDWRLTDGYLTEVSDKGSRIFTILSLNSLVRKLSLDFRDVFAKGFFYDEMQGSVQITQGKADTRDTFIDGAAGEIEIYGYTDLATKELNYNVSFTPNVTGNLPVLVYFFTVSPPSALAALALDQMLTSAKVISNVNYSVTGTIQDPILIETGRESTEVELPARRESTPETDDLPPFVPPSEDDLIEIEVKGDQSG